MPQTHMHIENEHTLNSRTIELKQESPSSVPTHISKVPALILPMRPCTVNYCQLFYGNEFYIVRIAILALMLLVQPLAVLRIQDGGLGHLEFSTFDLGDTTDGRVISLFMGFPGWGVHF